MDLSTAVGKRGPVPTTVFDVETYFKEKSGRVWMLVCVDVGSLLILLFSFPAHVLHTMNLSLERKKKGLNIEIYV